MASEQAFVALPKNGEVIFGINTNRPKEEVHEVIYVHKQKLQESKIKCTYIEINQTNDSVLPVILSKPGWAWGASSGANDKGVVAGTIWQREYGGFEWKDEKRDHLVPIDFVRLCLEQARTSEEGIDNITQLLESYGPSEINCQASYLIADAKEAWYLNTAGKLWAAQLIQGGFNSFCGGLNIKKMDKSCMNLKDQCSELGLWQENSNNSAFVNAEITEDFSITNMFEYLRDKQKNSFHENDDIPIQNSHVSSLSKQHLCCHWFTGTPDPSISVYKPFIFTPNAKVSPLTTCNNASGSYTHGLYKLHASGAGSTCAAMLKELESSCVEEVRQYIEGHSEADPELDELMKDCVEAEVKFYR